MSDNSNEPNQALLSINNQRNIKALLPIIACILISVLLSVALIMGVAQSHRHVIEVAEKVAVQTPLLGAVHVASKCKLQGGSIVPPRDPKKGGGNICSLLTVPGNWDVMPITGTYQYRYRTVDNTTISGGTDSDDLAVCVISSNDCRIE